MSFLKHHKFWLAFTFLFPFAIYAYTAYPSVPTEDAGELIAAAATLGIAHPPGYPLYVILGKIWSTLIPFGNIAWKINVMSGLFAALTISTVYALLQRITKSQPIAVITALIFAFTPILWSQSIRAEVYTLNAFLFAFIICLTICWSDSPQPKRQKFLYLLSFVFGLSLGNHHQMLLAAPALAIFILWRDKTLWRQPFTIFKAIICFLLGFSIYLYLPLRSLANPLLDWGNPETWDNFWAVFFRSTYGGSLLKTTEATSSISVFFPSWSTKSFELFDAYILKVFPRLFESGRFLLEDLFFQFHLLLVIAAAGLFRLFKDRRQRPLFCLTLLLGFFYSCYLFVIIFIIPLIFSRLQNEPFFIPFFIITLIPLAYGFAEIFKRLKCRIYLVLILALIPLFHLIWHFPTFNQNQNFIAHDVSSQLLSQLPKNSVLFMPLRDSSLFPLFYFQAIEGLRPDVTIYGTGENVYRPWKDYQQAHADHPGQPIFTYLPLELAPKTVYLPWPVFTQYLPQQTPGSPSIIFPKTPPQEPVIRGSNLPNLSYTDRGVLSSHYIALAIGHGPGDGKKMEEYFQRAKATSPDNYEVYFHIGHYYARLGLFDKARQNISTAYSLNPRPDYKAFLEKLSN